MASAPVDALPDQSQNLIDVDMECLNDKSGDGDVVPPSRMTTLSYSPTLEMLVGALYVETVFQNPVHSLSHAGGIMICASPTHQRLLEQFLFGQLDLFSHIYTYVHI